MTRTEQALRALAAALDASATLPQTRRNAPLDQVLEDIAAPGSANAAALVLIDGSGTVLDQVLGDGESRFSIEHHAEVEWLVSGQEGLALETDFDNGLEAIAAAVEVDRTLGGVVDDVQLNEPPERDLDVLGARPAKTAVLRVSLLFTSSHPF
jgi:hypothetical protein